MDKDHIFISFSGRHARKVASIIRDIIVSIYPSGSCQIEVFLSEDKIKAGNFRDQNLAAMKRAKFAIAIYTPTNISAAWLMFEAGALSLAIEQNGGHYMPYLFCRHGSDREPPIGDLQYVQYQIEHKENQEQFIRLIKNLNDSLSSENKVAELKISKAVNDAWSYINKEMHVEANNMLIPSASSIGEKELATSFNSPISISCIYGNFETNSQSQIRLADDFSPQSPKEIEKKFERILKTQIPEIWKQRNELDKTYNSTRVIVNNTRLSTFIVFTDGKRIVLFDRPKDTKNTNVTNPLLDVFGSVQFENRTIKNKIKNPDFFNSKILKVEEISGAAIENNKLKIGDDTETAVMFGACVHLSPRDLEKAKIGADEGDIVIYFATEIKNMNSELLTSKAMLGVNHVLKNLVRE